MRKYGIGIQTFSIGLPFPIKVAFRSKKIFDGAVLQITPLFLLGAFVKPTDEGEKRMKELPYKQQADIYGAGPLANILFSGILFVFYVLLKSRFGFLFWQWGYEPPIITGIIIGISVALFWGRKLFSRYIMLPMGITYLGMIGWEIFKDPMKSMAGPVGIAKIVGGATNLPDAIFIGMLLSFTIGLCNTLPLIPLDGWRTCDALIGRYARRGTQFYYGIVTGVILFGLFGFAIFSDFVK